MSAILERPSDRMRESAVLRGFLLTLVPVSLLLTGRPAHGTAPLLHEWFRVADVASHVGGALCLLFAALALDHTPRLARLAATLGIVSLAVFEALGVWNEPTLAFVLLVAGAAIVSRAWPSRAVLMERIAAKDAVQVTATASAWVALLAWWVAVPQEWGRELSLAAVAASAQIIATWLASLAIDRLQPRPARLARWPLVTWVCLFLGTALLGQSPLAAVTFLAVPSAARLALTRIPEERLRNLTTFWGALLDNPSRALVATFATVMAIGGLVLTLPVASGTGKPVSFLDALFTAVSATCVTGLTVIDTATGYSLFGQAVILLLIQIGGLGIMTFSAAAVVVLGVRTSVRYETTVADVIGAENLSTVDDALWRVFLVTATCEAIGATLLTALFLADGDPLPMAIWRGVFHAISAFCNAGFALQTTNMTPYTAHPSVLFVLSWLVILGGLGPATIWFAPRWLRRQRTPLTTKLALATTAVLLVAGTTLFLALEWDNTLAAMSPGNRVINAWFQAVVPRTAGFNSIDYAQCVPATWLLILLLMFVGGSPGSTAGGVKTTTIAVLLASVVASLRGRPEAIAFRRRMSHRSIYQATALATAGFGVAGFLTFGLLLTQDMPIHVALFEVVSALGTVGLTIGGTPLLDDVGKILIMGAMFAGRLGPLTLFLFLTTQQIDRPSGHPEEPVVVG